MHIAPHVKLNFALVPEINYFTHFNNLSAADHHNRLARFSGLRRE